MQIDYRYGTHDEIISTLPYDTFHLVHADMRYTTLPPQVLAGIAEEIAHLLRDGGVVIIVCEIRHWRFLRRHFQRVLSLQLVVTNRSRLWRRRVTRPMVIACFSRGTPGSRLIADRSGIVTTLHGNDYMLDLFPGDGTRMLTMARRGVYVVGIEPDPVLYLSVKAMLADSESRPLAHYLRFAPGVSN